MGEKANVWLNWYPGLKIIENKGFIEAEDTHYISSESGSVLSFYTENVASGNIMCIFEGGVLGFIHKFGDEFAAYSMGRQ